MLAPRRMLSAHVRYCLLVMSVFVCACWPTYTPALAHSAPVPILPLEIKLDTPTAHFFNTRADLRTTESLTANLAVNTQAATVGGTLVYTLTLVNKSTEPAAFDVSDTLPDNLVLVDAPGMTASGQALTASDMLNSGAQQQFVITARIHAYRFTVENRATVRSGAQTQTVSAPVVRVASAAASVHYLPLIMR